MNAASGVIDGSGLYEATEKEFQALRTYTNEKVDIKIYPLLNEHNRVAEKLHKLNNHVADAHIILYNTKYFLRRFLQQGYLVISSIFQYEEKKNLKKNKALLFSDWSKTGFTNKNAEKRKKRLKKNSNFCRQCRLYSIIC